MRLANTAPARPASAGRRLAALWAPALPAIVFLAVFFVVPVLQILQGGFFNDAGAPDASLFQRLVTAPVYVKVLWTTFGISLATAVLSVALGYPLAYWLGMMSERSRGRWVLWIMLPFWTSYLVKTYAWMLLLSRTGLLTTVASLLGLTGESGSLAPSLLGVLVGMVHAMLPLAVLTIMPTMQGINRQLSSAAEILGAGRATNFLTVFFPLSLPGVAAAGLLVFITCLGFFIVPALLGTPRESMIAQLVISSVLELVDMRFAGALSIVILLCSIVVFYVYDRLVGLTSLAGEASQRNTGGPGWAMRLLYGLGGALDKVFATGSLRARYFLQDDPLAEVDDHHREFADAGGAEDAFGAPLATEGAPAPGSKAWERATQGQTDEHALLTLWVSLAAGTPKKTLLTEKGAAALLRKIQKDGWDAERASAFIQGHAPPALRASYLALWQGFVQESQATLCSDHVGARQEALALLRRECHVAAG